MELYYINLDNRVDRKKEFLAECKRIGYPLWQIYRFPAIRDTKMPYLGCTRSHLAVLKLARERKLPMVFIAEDDLNFVSTLQSYEELLKLVESTGGEFDVIMLASNSLKVEATSIKGLQRVKEAQTASGYIVHSKFYDRLIACLEYGVSKLVETGIAHLWMNDQIWKRLQKQSDVLWYVCEPKLGYQRPSYSDLAFRVVNYGC